MIVTIHSNDNSLNWAAEGDERIIQNAKNIVRTRLYEIPFMRYLGINPDYIDSSHRELISDFNTRIKNVIETYEPRVSVQDVRLESCDENGGYIIAVDLEVL